MRKLMPIFLGVLFLSFLAACVQSENDSSINTRKQDYSLCPRNDQSRSQLLALVREFAARNQARLVDRGPEAQNELNQTMGGHELLNDTGGDLIVLMVEKPNQYRISLSNAGLREKIALSVRYWTEREEDSGVAELLSNIERSWVVEPVDAGVTDAPLCDPLNAQR